MYQFSAPLPKSIKECNKLLEINSKIKKSKITSLYFTMDSIDKKRLSFEICRKTSKENQLFFEQWLEIAKYCSEKNFKIIYILDSFSSHYISAKFRELQYFRLNNTISKLRTNNCFTIETSDMEILTFLNKHYKNLNINSSYLHNYNNIKQFKNYIKTFPDIQQLSPSTDSNKNFLLLKNLKKNFPNINIELIVNEGCLHNCPYRYNCIASRHDIFYTKNSSDFVENIIPDGYLCKKISSLKLPKDIVKTNTIHPWEISEYNKIGINNFKLIGRKTKEFDTGEIYNNYFIYLKAIDDLSSVQNEKYSNLSIYAKKNNINYTIKEIKPYLPKISHFIKKGHLCASECDVECNYCHKCAEKFKKYLEKHEEI